MRVLSLTLALGAALLLGACGDKADNDGPTTGGTGGAESTAGALEGAAWDGGTGFDPTQKSDKVRVIQFFKPT